MSVSFQVSRLSKWRPQIVANLTASFSLCRFCLCVGNINVNEGHCPCCSPRENDDERGASGGCEKQLVVNSARPTVSCGSSATGNNERSATSNRPGDPVGERTTRKQGTTEYFRIPLRRTDDPRHHRQHRLQEINPTSTSKRRRIEGRVVDALGNDIGEFTGTSIVTQEVPVTTTQHLQVLPTQSDIDITSEFIVEKPIPDALNSVDWRCYIAYIRAKFLNA